MSTSFGRHVVAKDFGEVINNAGGRSFIVNDEARLTRFLVLGTDGGTYYTTEEKLTLDNVAFLKEMVARDEHMVSTIVSDIASTGRSYRKSALIFATAVLIKFGKVKSSDLVQTVCTTSTQLFELASYFELLGGWSRATRRVIADWYLARNTSGALALQLVKYRQRDGWTHRDMLRLSHPVGLDSELVNFALGKDLGEIINKTIYGFECVQDEGATLESVISDVVEFKLPWETVPTQYHKNAKFWEALFYNNLINGQALLRNITRFARLGMFDSMQFTADFVSKVTDVEMIKRTRLHPLQYLLAIKVHSDGQTDRKHGYGRNKDWSTSPQLLAGLNVGFELAFTYSEPSDKRTFIGLDVSGSMSSGVTGTELSAAELAAAMCMTVANTERLYTIKGFDTDLIDLNIHAGMDLHSVLKITENRNFGGTDCAKPMLWAAARNIEVDTFLVMTDNETWAGSVKPYVALQRYRDKTGIPAKLIVAAMTPTRFTIADPSDSGMLDICGGDANLPSLVANFSAGRI